MTAGRWRHSSDAEGLAWLRSQPPERERRPTGGRGWNRVPVGPSAPGGADRRLHSEERESDHCETRCHSGCYERCYRVCYGNSGGDRESLGNSRCYRGCYRYCYTCYGSEVAENAADICHAVRLRLNQSLTPTTTEMRLRAKLGAAVGTWCGKAVEQLSA